MYSLSNFCWICLTNNNIFKLSDKDDNGITHINKLTSSLVEMDFEELNDQRFICEECCTTLNTVYIFQQKCLRSKTNLITYISQLHMFSKVSGKINVRLKDIQQEIKVEKQDKDLQDSIRDQIYTSVTIKNEYDSEENSNVAHEKHIFANNICSDIEEEEMENINITTQDYCVRDGAEHINIDSEEETENPDGLENDDDDFNCDTEIVFNEMEVIGKDYCVRNADNFEQQNLNIDDKDEMINRNDDNYEEVLNEDPDMYCKKEIDIEELHISQLKGEPMLDTDTPHDGSTSQAIDVDAEINKNNETDDDKSSEDDTLKKDVIRHICEICNKEFRLKKYLTTHMKNHSSEKIYECEICQKKFIYSMTFTKHMRTHNRQRRHECLLCGKKFTRAGILTTHMRIHTGERPFECEICEKTFKQSAALGMHMLSIHSGKRSYECDVCGKAFKRKGILENHKRLHDDERLYECKICKKTFKQSSVLYGHMRVHTGDRSYECGICHMKFAQKFSCSRHMVTKHSNGNTRQPQPDFNLFPQVDFSYDNASQQQHFNVFSQVDLSKNNTSQQHFNLYPEVIKHF